ncbi:MAG: ATP-binding protein [Phycisphaerae bacterium]
MKTSLALKFRLLFGAAVLLIIAMALVVPWYFMELLAEQALQQRGAELTRLVINEHLADAKDPATSAQIARYYTAGGQKEGQRGPVFIKLSPDMKPGFRLDAMARDALRFFRRTRDQDLTVSRTEDEDHRPVYRSFRAMRAEQSCMACHGPTGSPQRQFQPGQLVGMIDVTLPADTSASVGVSLIWLTRAVFIAGAALATLLAIILLTLIVQRLVLRPVRQLRAVADKVTEGDLTVRSRIRTGDELQRLGESFNEMLSAIADQHDKLRAANRALDLKLHELAEANVTLFQANSVKTEFLANVSHELRTPLNSIIGFADLLAEANDERLRRYALNISTSSKSLLSMINDLLDLARIEAGKAVVNWDKVSIDDLCRTLVSLMKPLADKKQLEMETQLADDLPIVVTDAGKVQQILYNLLSNAIKFTPSGGNVIVSARTETAVRGGAEIKEVTVSVADTGPGIAEVDQQRIFEKFHQGDRSLTKESSGTGLGLAISKELTNLLGGRLTLKSSPGHGTVFTLTLPLAPAGDATVSPAQAGGTA